MSESPPDPRREVALFRFKVIAGLLHLKAGSPEAGEALRANAELTYQIPGSRRTRVAAGTMRGWIEAYREGGFDALHPKPRSDRGRNRRIPPELAELLVEIKQRSPHLSGRAVRRKALESDQMPAGTAVALSSVYRLLHGAGLMDRPETAAPDRRRFSFASAAEMWQSDVMHGPQVGCDSADRRRRKKSYLLAFLDDSTRLVPHAAFTFSESIADFLPVFKQALLKRGIPQRLYVDNGANYRSRHLQVICATLGINLIHATPYRPEGKGKIERLFRTCRSQLLPSLQDKDTRSLDAINARLASWLESEYHVSPHRGLDNDEVPLDAWARTAHAVRTVGPDIDIDTIFRYRHKRLVGKDRTVTLHSTLYEVDAALCGETVTLLQDLSAPRERPIPILHKGVPAGQATLLDAYANTRVRRTRTRDDNAADQADDPAPEPDPRPCA